MAQRLVGRASSRWRSSRPPSKSFSNSLRTATSLRARVHEDRAVLGGRDVPLQALEDERVLVGCSRAATMSGLTFSTPILACVDAAVVGDDHPVQAVRRRRAGPGRRPGTCRRCCTGCGCGGHRPARHTRRAVRGALAAHRAPPRRPAPGSRTAPRHRRCRPREGRRPAGSPGGGAVPGSAPSSGRRGRAPGRRRCPCGGRDGHARAGGHDRGDGGGGRGSRVSSWSRVLAATRSQAASPDRANPGQTTAVRCRREHPVKTWPRLRSRDRGRSCRREPLAAGTRISARQCSGVSDGAAMRDDTLWHDDRSAHRAPVPGVDDLSEGDCCGKGRGCLRSTGFPQGHV